jgi:hypothetical protein
MMNKIITQNECKKCGKETSNKYFCSLSCGTSYRENEKSIQRREEYLSNPNLCKKCRKPILPRDGEKISYTKTRVCCDTGCWSRPKRHGKVNECPVCRKKIAIKAKTCNKHKPKMYVNLGNNKTKGHLLDIRSGYQSARSTIRKHAFIVFKETNRRKACYNCGYKAHIEVCHIKPVSQFDNDATLEDINNPNNLIGLCPNCHWEFDHGILLYDTIRTAGLKASVGNHNPE